MATNIKLRVIFISVLSVFICGLSQPISTARAQQIGQPVAPKGYCQLATLSSSIGLASCVRGAFTGTGSGVNLTTTSVTGIIKVGDTVTGTGVPAGTTIVSQTSGTTGGAGVYVTSVATTSSSASLTSGGIPPGSNGVFLQAEGQIVRYRDDGGVPTSSVGMPLAATGSVYYVGTLSALRFIEATSGGKINALFYKAP